MPRREKKSGPKKNYIVLIVDESGSMSRCRSETQDAINALQNEIASSSAIEGHDTRVSMVLFSTNAVFKYFNIASHALQPVRDYTATGSSTNIWDAIGLAIDGLVTLPDAGDSNVSFLINVITDGGHNATGRYTEAAIAQKMSSVIKTDRWTFAFNVPPGYKSSLLGRFDFISSDNVREWEGSRLGMEGTRAINTVSTQSFFAARSAGATRVDNFYTTTDASKLNTQKLAAKLDDLSGQFKPFEVKAEMPAKEFIEQKTRKAFVVGSLYYQLMKPEFVHGHKRVLLVEKGKKAVWGGEEARQLIGLPPGNSTKVTPGNHGNYDIFVQSTSVNRKLPRGTRILWDSGQAKDLKPTWDHEKAKKEADAKKIREAKKLLKGTGAKVVAN